MGFIWNYNCDLTLQAKKNSMLFRPVLRLAKDIGFKFVRHDGTPIKDILVPAGTV
jgi:hypothetical protein